MPELLDDALDVGIALGDRAAEAPARIGLETDGEAALADRRHRLPVAGELGLLRARSEASQPRVDLGW